MSEFTVATWNVNSLKVRLGHLTRWLAEHCVDLIALQETKTEDAKFPRAEIEATGYKAVWHGQRTYNGVALLARTEPEEVRSGIAEFADDQARVLAATVQGLRVVDVYVPNGQTVGSEKYAYKLQWLAALRRYLSATTERYPNVIVLGDFNIAPEDRDVHDPKAWEGAVHVSPAERAALAALSSDGWVDVFRRFDQPPRSFSWWDYRAGAFRRDHGLRIDLILANRALAERCRMSRIDRAPRALEQPSDHVPVLASFSMPT